MPYVNHLYYEETGAGRPVLFIHCPALSHIYWRPIMERLAPLCRCIAIDLRGHGKSGLGEKPWSFADIAADLAMLTRDLALADPVLVGYSAGGSIALQAALQDPVLYGGVVAVSAFSECTTWHLRAKVAAGLAALQLGLLRFIGEAVLRTNAVDAAHSNAMLPDARGVAPMALRSYLMGVRRVNLTDRLHGIRIPVLLAFGADDELMHPYYRILHARLPDSRAVIFPAVNHRIPTRRPAEFADTVAEFLGALTAEPEEALPTFVHPGVFLPEQVSSHTDRITW